MNRSEIRWIKESGQQWKLKTSYWLQGASILFLSLLLIDVFDSIDIFSDHVILWFFIMLVFIVLFLVSLAWLNYSIKCPHCRNSVGGTFFDSRNVGAPMNDLIFLEYCPFCKEKMLKDP